MTGDLDAPDAPDASTPGATTRVSIASVEPATEGSSSVRERRDYVAVEEPLEIRILEETAGKRRSHCLSVTMRSPGHDFELACGFLLAEGILAGAADLWRVSRCDQADPESADNVVEVHLKPGVSFDPGQHRRATYTSSSCGVCGKESIEQLRRLGGTPPVGDLRLEPRAIDAMPDRLLSGQGVFSNTGGLHACGLFSAAGDLALVREDVGRHNAVDKVVGRLLLSDALPASSKVLFVSGRASFELVHKTMAAGISTLLAVGAPSSLAVETARKFGMTLVGFVRDGRFNVYCGRRRIVF